MTGEERDVSTLWKLACRALGRPDGDVAEVASLRASLRARSEAFSAAAAAHRRAWDAVAEQVLDHSPHLCEQVEEAVRGAREVLDCAEGCARRSREICRACVASQGREDERRVAEAAEDARQTLRAAVEAVEELGGGLAEEGGAEERRAASQDVAELCACPETAKAAEMVGFGSLLSALRRARVAHPQMYTYTVAIVRAYLAKASSALSRLQRLEEDGARPDRWRSVACVTSRAVDGMVDAASDDMRSMTQSPLFQSLARSDAQDLLESELSKLLSAFLERLCVMVERGGRGEERG